MPPHLLVLPSPFLGPAPYEPVVAALSSRGYAASVAPSSGSPVAGDLLAAWARWQPSSATSCWCRTATPATSRRR